MTVKIIDYYVVKVAYESEQTQRNEFGWVEGHAPGCGIFVKSTETYNIQSPSEPYVEIFLKQYFSGSGCRNFEIISIEKMFLRIDGIITVS